MKQKNFFFEKKKSKWPTQKNWVFQPPPKAEQLSPKFHKLVLGWVGLIDAKDIHFAQPIWSSGCPTAWFVKFWRKLLSFWGWLKNSVFLSRPFWNFFAKKKKFFCFIPIKISQHWDSKAFWKYWWLHWFPENFWCAYTFATQCTFIGSDHTELCRHVYYFLV